MDPTFTVTIFELVSVVVIFELVSEMTSNRCGTSNERISVARVVLARLAIVSVPAPIDHDIIKIVLV